MENKNQVPNHQPVYCCFNHLVPCVPPFFPPVPPIKCHAWIDRWILLSRALSSRPLSLEEQWVLGAGTDRTAMLNGAYYHIIYILHTMIYILLNDTYQDFSMKMGLSIAQANNGRYHVSVHLVISFTRTKQITLWLRLRICMPLNLVSILCDTVAASLSPRNEATTCKCRSWRDGHQQHTGLNYLSRFVKFMFVPARSKGCLMNFKNWNS